ncbi:geranylgeranyl reductase family [Desulfacinum infernum DSM 9756]|uniref:Geranylgeranyl reductase family n=1 Tax=Desulfacinum infernum DSM 9756 TaxID=1121391 RepID=A0A1M5A243_9BACT|nr:geranylgeranyl reductase family protein [Desulfacinum infernum]SHF24331.1 geranylgeranyl reductase family [Desulfacinum infernum DSM 9756]
MLDCIIVGAGPAGASAARRAAQKGLRTLVLEKEIFPRPKPCGGALSVQGLSHLDFPLPPHLIERTISGVRAVHGRLEIRVESPQPICVLVRRSAFDQLLLEKALEAGAECRQGERVLACRESGSLVTVQTDKGSYQARYAILAHGASGRPPAAALTDGRRKATTHWLTVVGEAAPEWRERGTGRDPAPVLEFYFDACPGGYGWVFPLKNAASVGVGGLAGAARRPVRLFREFVGRLGIRPLPAYRGCPIPCSGIARRLGSDRILIAGDAGGFAEAFSGEGIAYAVRSGQIAAETLSDAATGAVTHSLAGEYRRRCRDALGDNLIYARLFALGAYGFPGLFFRVFDRHRSLGEEFLKIPRGLQTYRGFFAHIRRRLAEGLILRRNSEP